MPEESTEVREAIDLPQGVSIDALFVANHAEAPGGLLYAAGGGWTRCWPSPTQEYPYDRVLNIVLMIRVPYYETNQDHRLDVAIVDSDGAKISPEAEGKFRKGRDAVLLEGMSQTAVMTLSLPATLEAPGIYEVVAIVGTDSKRIQFEALSAAPPPNV